MRACPSRPLAAAGLCRTVLDPRPALPAAAQQHHQHRRPAPFEPGFIASVRPRDPENAVRLARAFAAHDVIERQHIVMQRYNADSADLAAIIATYTLFAFTLANGLPTASQQALRQLTTRVAGVHPRPPAFATATPEDRQRAAAALILQAGFLHFASVAARQRTRRREPPRGMWRGDIGRRCDDAASCSSKGLDGQG